MINFNILVVFYNVIATFSILYSINWLDYTVYSLSLFQDKYYSNHRILHHNSADAVYPKQLSNEEKPKTSVRV